MGDLKAALRSSVALLSDNFDFSILSTQLKSHLAPIFLHNVPLLSFYGFFSLDVKVVISAHCYIYAILLLPRALQIVKSLRAWFRV